MPLSTARATELAESLAGKRVALDVSVLLAGLLDQDSPSARLLDVMTRASVILSDHVEERARVVLHAAAPHLLPTFNDGLLRLAGSTDLRRVVVADAAALPTWAVSALSDEDARVLAGAVLGDSSWLFTHDRDFFKGPISGMAVSSPSSFVWDPLEGANVQRGPDSFTFLGWFYPQWGTEIIRGSADLFYFFEIANFVWAYYSARDSAVHVHWHRLAGSKKGLTLPISIDVGSYNFVSVIVRPGRVSLFVNGESRERAVLIGGAPAETTFHPFMSAKSEHQIFGSCQFRVADSALTARTVRRHWQAHSVRLADGELQFAEWADRSSLIVPASEGRIVVSST